MASNPRAQCYHWRGAPTRLSAIHIGGTAHISLRMGILHSRWVMVCGIVYARFKNKRFRLMGRFIVSIDTFSPATQSISLLNSRNSVFEITNLYALSYHWAMLKTKTLRLSSRSSIPSEFTNPLPQCPSFTPLPEILTNATSHMNIGGPSSASPRAGGSPRYADWL